MSEKGRRKGEGQQERVKRTRVRKRERGGWQRERDGRERVLRRKTENERATERSGAVLSWLYRRERLLRRLPRRKRRRSRPLGDGEGVVENARDARVIKGAVIRKREYAASGN